MSTFSDGPSLQAVLVFPIFRNEVLLARKTRSIGIGRWNGYGGKLKQSESAVEAALRELREESGIRLTPLELEEAAVLDCQNYFDAEGMHRDSAMHVAVYVAKLEHRPHPRATDGMAEPRWFPIHALPLEEMIATDGDWLPRILTGEKLYVCVHNGPGQRTRVHPTEIRPLSPSVALFP